MGYMEELTNTSGGRTFLQRKESELLGFSLRAAQEIDNLYRIELEIVAPAVDRKPQWQKFGLKVVVDKNDKAIGKASLRTREGYYSVLENKESK
jgi:hypothetical protein